MAQRTATATLMEVLEDFGDSEPKECIVVYTNSNGELCWSSTTDSVVIKIGLLEAAKLTIAARNSQGSNT